MVEYRTFRNSDPPHLVRLWHECELGRGAAFGILPDALDLVTTAQPYFDPAGLILACKSGTPVGFAHAGFAADERGSALDRSIGVTCAVLVHPEHRRNGIGRELIGRCETYLRERGTTQLLAGPAPGRDPFYYGIYGGSEPAGFLESDEAARPFFEAIGYRPIERHLVFQRDLNTSDPADFRLIGLRRKSQLTVSDRPIEPSWWWYTHTARLESVRMGLVEKSNASLEAALTAAALDVYLPVWQERVIGLSELDVSADDDPVAWGRLLITDSLKQFRDEMFTRAEMHAPEKETRLVETILSAGFGQVDAGAVYRREH